MAGVILALVVFVMAPVVTRTGADTTFPAMFVFGDSLSDPGNNNNLFTLAKANFLPYGIDFPTGPTGRVSNGLLTVDYIATSLGLPLIPPFNNKTTKAEKIIKGVSYASSASGILNETGIYYGDVFTMDEQVKNFRQTVGQLAVELPNNDTQVFLANSLFFVNIGSNDFIGNYLIPTSWKFLLYTEDQFIDLLLSKFSKQLKDLYNLGARKFLVAGLLPLGCIPRLTVFSLNQSECVKPVNEIAVKFNAKLQPLLTQLRGDLSSSNFVYGEQYYLALNVINNPAQYGFKYTTKSCCGIGNGRFQFFCLPIPELACKNRSEYIFMDSAHPTSASNKYIAEGLVPLAKTLLD